VAKNGVELQIRARVTVRTNLAQLIGGATEETIIARVGEGIITAREIIGRVSWRKQGPKNHQGPRRLHSGYVLRRSCPCWLQIPSPKRLNYKYPIKSFGIVRVDLATFHHEDYFLHDSNIGQWVAFNRNHVRELSWIDATDVFVAASKFSAIDSGRT